MTMFDKAVVSMQGRGRTAQAPFGGHVLIHATAADTGGALGIWETVVPPGKGPAPHMHRRETEVFRVLHGTFQFRCGEETVDLTAGAVIALPPHVWHSWRNIGDDTGRLMGIVTPGGFEQLFLDIAATGAETPEEIAVIEARLGIVNEETIALTSQAM